MRNDIHGSHDLQMDPRGPGHATVAEYGVAGEFKPDLGSSAETSRNSSPEYTTIASILL